MPGSARVHDPDALRRFRLALLNFSEKVTNSLGEAEAEIQRVTMWLENEQATYWAGELRKRQADVNKAKEALPIQAGFQEHHRRKKFDRRRTKGGGAGAAAAGGGRAKMRKCQKMDSPASPRIALVPRFGPAAGDDGFDRCAAGRRQDRQDDRVAGTVFCPEGARSGSTD